MKIILSVILTPVLLATPMVGASQNPAHNILTTVKNDMTLSSCQWIQSPDNPNGPLGGGFSPAMAVQSYWYEKFKEVMPIKDAKVTILDAPKHGVIEGRGLTKKHGPYFEYLANSGFIGKDKVTFLVEVGGKHVKVVMDLIVDISNLDQGDSPCSGVIQRINSNNSHSIQTPYQLSNT